MLRTGLRRPLGALGPLSSRGLASTALLRSTPLPPPPSSSSSSSSSSPPTSPFLQKHAPALASLSKRTGTPLPSLVLSFAILHELTAVVPVVGLYYILQWAGAGAGVVLWLSSLADGEGEGESAWWHAKVAGWYAEGSARVERVGRRYGILGFKKGGEGEGEEARGQAGEVAHKVADAVGAYVLVKALLPLRIALSIGAAPAFARFALNPVQRAWRRMLRR